MHFNAFIASSPCISNIMEETDDAITWPKFYDFAGYVIINILCSFVFILKQITELVSEVVPKKQRNKALDEVLHELNSLLLSLPDGTEERKVQDNNIYIIIIYYYFIIHA